MSPKEKRRASRARRGPVTAECLTCKFTTTATTWRPAKRALREHSSKKHRTLA